MGVKKAQEAISGPLQFICVTRQVSELPWGLGVPEAFILK